MRRIIYTVKQIYKRRNVNTDEYRAFQNLSGKWKKRPFTGIMRPIFAHLIFGPLAAQVIESKGHHETTANQPN